MKIPGIFTGLPANGLLSRAWLALLPGGLLFLSLFLASCAPSPLNETRDGKAPRLWAFWENQVGTGRHYLLEAGGWGALIDLPSRERQDTRVRVGRIVEGAMDEATEGAVEGQGQSPAPARVLHLPDNYQLELILEGSGELRTMDWNREDLGGSSWVYYPASAMEGLLPLDLLALWIAAVQGGTDQAAAARDTVPAGESGTVPGARDGTAGSGTLDWNLPDPSEDHDHDED